ncbi:MAG: hypothetical protein K5985_06480 [Lachnospiraceae bacterium]|nr:hypothetical protein [Lachnospiraceae bacterium]
MTKAAAFFRENRLALIVAAVHWVITFFTDRLVFSFGDNPSYLTYASCKALLLVFLFFIYRALLRHTPDTLTILKFAGIYLIPIIAVLIFKLPQGFLSNDEVLIAEEARLLHEYTWFTYLTTWYYIISMMIIPFRYGPILVKVVLQLLICGYCVFRLSAYLGKKYGCWLYAAFLLFPVLAYTTSAHRIPVYFLLYLFELFTLQMDLSEGKNPSKGKLVWLLLLGAVLTQWRTEGIYLVAVLPLLLFLTYPGIRRLKTAWKVLLVFFLIQYIVQIPQNGVLPLRMGDKADNRMGPFYAYTITNMFREGLDREKNKEDIALVNRFLDVEKIDAINEALGEINYEDTLILYYPGYVGVREGAEDEDYKAYLTGCKNIFINNPDVFLKTRLGAFHYAATPYEPRWDGGLFSGLLSLVKTVAYNLYLPHLLLFLLCLYALFRSRWWTVSMCAGLMCHSFIVFVLAPASYFKYYFPIYFVVYFWMIFLCIGEAWNLTHREERKILVR